MPTHWDWPLRPPLTVTALAKKIVWDDVWAMPSTAELEGAATGDTNLGMILPVLVAR